jgi:hypothetical protein
MTSPSAGMPPPGRQAPGRLDQRCHNRLDAAGRQALSRIRQQVGQRVSAPDACHAAHLSQWPSNITSISVTNSQKALAQVEQEGARLGRATLMAREMSIIIPGRRAHRREAAGKRSPP